MHVKILLTRRYNINIEGVIHQDEFKTEMLED